MLAFSLGTVSGFLLAGKGVQAERKFGPDIVKGEAPSKFLEGGDRDYFTFKEILAALQESNKHLANIEGNTKSIDGTVQSISGKLDSPNKPSTYFRQEEIQK
jgi:hypothetical protein